MTDLTPLQRYLLVQRDMDRQMAKVLRDAANEGQRIINNLASKGTISAQVTRAEKAIIVKRLREQADVLWGTVHDELTSAMKMVGAQAAEGENLLRRVMFGQLAGPIPEFERAMHMKAQSHIDNYISRTQNDIPLSESVYRTKALSNGLVDREINRSILLGEGHEKLANRVRKFIDPATPGGTSYAANRLARTELNNAFHTTQINQREKEPWTAGMKWELSGSHPKPDECNDYASSVHFKGGDPGVYKAGDVPGKPHPNCLCYMTTVQVSNEEMMQRFLHGDYNTYIDEQVYLHAPNIAPC